MKITKLSLALASLTFCFSALAGDWPQWRGPHFDGSSDETGLPSTWTKETAVWVTEMPGPSATTPAIMGDRVYLPAADFSNKTLLAMCLDRKTGKVLWSRPVGEGAISRGDNSNFSSPSAVATKDRAYFFYGNGLLAAFDLQGKQVWLRDIQKDYGEFAYQWTFSASPLLHGSKLYIQVLQRNEPVHGHGKPNGDSYLLALNPATGETLWRQVRPSDAVQESKEAYSTPMPFEFQGHTEILISGGDCLTGHDPVTGREIWRWGTYNPMKIGHWRLVPSPVAGGGVVLGCAPKGDPIYAIKLGGKGTLTDSDIAWKTERRIASSDVPTPLFYQGDFFVLSEAKKTMSRIEPASGNVKWTASIPGRAKFEASPTAGDGKIYLMNFAGEVVIMDAAKGEILGTVSMGEPGDDMIRSSISIASRQLFIRTNHKLFCIGSK